MIGDLELDLGAVALSADFLHEVGVVAGIAAGLALTWKRVGWRGTFVLATAVIAGIWGGRVLGVWYRGFSSILGAIIGGFVGMVAAAPLFRVPLGTVASSCAPAVALGQGIGRLGCLVAGCCFGRPTTLPWGVQFSAMSHAGFSIGPAPLHPTQVYESIVDLVLAAVLFRLLWKKARDEIVVGSYFVGYGMIRFLVEFFRADWRPIYGALVLPQWIAILFVVGGGMCLLKSSPTRV